MKRILMLAAAILTANLLLAAEQAAEKEPETARPDYVQLKLGNRWVLKTNADEEVTFEAVKKLDNNSLTILVSQKGKKDKDMLTWKIEDGFFCMMMEKGSLKVLRLPPKNGDTWEFPLTDEEDKEPGPVCKASVVKVPKLVLPIGTFEDCFAVSLVTGSGKDIRKLIYVFAPGVGLVGMEIYANGKLKESAKLVEARVNGKVIKPEKKETKNEKEKPAPAKKELTKEEAAAKKAFEAAIQKFIDKDLEALYKCMSAKFRKEHALKDFTKRLSKNFDERAKLMKKLEITGVKIDPEKPDSAVVTAKLKGEEESLDTIKLVLEDGEWKILDL